MTSPRDLVTMWPPNGGSDFALIVATLIMLCLWKFSISLKRHLKWYVTIVDIFHVTSIGIYKWRNREDVVFVSTSGTSLVRETGSHVTKLYVCFWVYICVTATVSVAWVSSLYLFNQISNYITLHKTLSNESEVSLKQNVRFLEISHLIYHR